MEINPKIFLHTGYVLDNNTSILNNKSNASGRARSPSAPSSPSALSIAYSSFVASTYLADLSLTERMAIARECDRQGLKAKAAIIRSGVMNHLLQLTNGA
jgi:hypothetical protein